MPIHVLPSDVADQIAAGEVVERPASVIKELVENSIDAGATEIIVRVDEGGKKLIEVEDNGRGMNESDATKCILRHATSKISQVDDLFSLQSFGFRGEALAAIASVSEFELATKTKEASNGTLLRCQAGKPISVTTTALNAGTRISVKNLFEPVPVRLQYMKTEATEYRAIYKEVVYFALCHENISFQLYKDGKLVLDLPQSDLSQRLGNLLKLDANIFCKVDSSGPNLSVSGWVGRPEQAVKSKTHQYIYVNQRRIDDFRLYYAVREAYLKSCGIEKHLYPVFVLFLNVDPILVDVNVHPRKLEVKFSEPFEVFSFLKKSVIASLEQGSDSPISFNPSYKHGKPTPSISDHPTGSQISKGNSFSQTLLRNSTPSFSELNQTRSFQVPATEPQTLPVRHANEEASLRLIGQLDNRYILAEGERGLYIFDQHALHERQRFERLLVEAKEKSVSVQKLLLLQPIELSKDELLSLQEHQEVLTSLGFSLVFSDDQLEVLALPSILSGANLDHLFQDFASFFEDESQELHSIELLLRSTLERQSCRGSVMFGDPLTELEMQTLLNDFAETDWKLLCPHGRPNHVFFSSDDLSKMFHR